MPLKSSLQAASQQLARELLCVPILYLDRRIEWATSFSSKPPLFGRMERMSDNGDMANLDFRAILFSIFFFEHNDAFLGPFSLGMKITPDTKVSGIPGEISRLSEASIRPAEPVSLPCPVSIWLIRIRTIRDEPSLCLCFFHEISPCAKLAFMRPARRTLASVTAAFTLFSLAQIKPRTGQCSIYSQPGFFLHRSLSAASI